jgi:hypothetical protein
MPLFNQPPLLQTVATQVTTDVTNAVAGWQPLLTINITTGANPLIISAAGAISNTGTSNNMGLRVTVDGVSTRGVQLRSPAINTGAAFSINVKTAPVSAGAHTIILEWQTSAGTEQCRPLTANIDGESASLVVKEVTV